MSITQLLLDFLLNLLKDPEAAEEFKADPEGVLEKHGLGDIKEEDCDAVIPVVLDFAPVSKIGDRVYETGGNGLTGGDAHYSGGGAHHAPSTPSVGDGGAGAHAPAVAQLTHVVHNYSYSSIDDRDTITDQSVNQNIWALGDVYQAFDNEANVASGDYAVAAGDDAVVDNSDDHSTNIDVDGDVNIGNTETDIDDSFNDDHSTDNSIDVDVEVEDSIIANESFNEEETDNSTNVDIDDSVFANDSFNEDNSVHDSGNTEIDLENVLNDNSQNLDATNSFNETDVDVDAEFENSFNEDTAIAQDSFNPEDSLNDNSTNVTTGDIDVEAEFTKNEDSVVFEENDVNVAVDDAAVFD